MASNHTQHYDLSQWQPTDEVIRTDFNADNAKIDAALNALAEGQAALTAEVAKKGNCRIQYGTYRGTATSKGVTVTFEGPPLLVVIGYFGYRTILLRGDNRAVSLTGSAPFDTTTITWSGNSVNIRPGSDNEPTNSSADYYFVALLDAGEE